MSLSLQIKGLAEQGCTAGEIAESLRLELPVVEFELSRLGRLDEEDIPEEDIKVIFKNLVAIAKDPGEEFCDRSLSAKVGMYLVDRKRGVAKAQQAPAVNIGMINLMIQQANERVKNQLLNRQGNNRGAESTPCATSTNTKEG